VTATANVAEALAEGGGVESHLHPPGSWAVEDHPVPSGREEVWRFTPLRRLRGLHADAPFLPGVTKHEWTHDEYVRSAVDGEATQWRGISGYVPTERVTARVFAEAPASLAVDVPAEAIIDEPIVVTVTGTDAKVTEAGHLAIRFGAHSRASVVLQHNGSASIAQVVEILVEDGAEATVTTVHDWADDTVHLVHHAARVGRDARLKHVSVSFGGDVVRFSASVDYAGPGGQVEMLGVYFADAGQHLENRLFVDHNAPHTTSNVGYKGAMQGPGAHGVWVGDVLIRKVAEGISTFESNRNLLLTDGARADSVPNLEIETGEIVGAGHASATGRFDDEQMFYLQSRGIAEDEARRLVVRGFFADVIKRIGIPDIESRLLEAIEAELAATAS
jgi:Fe-S cluster assembly protein SufD